MSLLEALNFLPKPPDSRPAREIEGDILDELQFHLDMKARDLEAAGMNPEQAREIAQEKFGDLDRVFQRCRRAKLGERVMLQRLMAVGLVFLLGAVVFLGIQMKAISSQLAAIVPLAAKEAPIEPTLARAAAVPSEDVTGYVTDVDLNPIESQVQLTVKLWHAGKFDRFCYTTVTDPSGRFRFASIVPPVDRYSIHLAVFAKGYAFQSDFFEGMLPEKKPRPFRFELGKAVKLQLSVVDQNDDPFQGVKVKAMERGHAGQYAHHTEPGAFDTYEVSRIDGRVSLPYFAAGDRAGLLVDFGDGDGWKEVEINLNEKDSPQLFQIKGMRGN